MLITSNICKTCEQYCKDWDLVSSNW